MQRKCDDSGVSWRSPHYADTQVHWDRALSLVWLLFSYISSNLIYVFCLITRGHEVTWSHWNICTGHDRSHWREPVEPAALLPPLSHPQLNVLCSTLFILVYSNMVCVSVRSQTVGWTEILMIIIYNLKHLKYCLFMFIYFLRYFRVFLWLTKDRLGLLSLFLF